MNVYSEFRSGSIINRQMLISLRDYPIDLVNELYRAYPNGIIHGFEVEVHENVISVGSGIVKYEDRILLMDKAQELSVVPGVWHCVLDVSSNQIDNCEETMVVPKPYQLSSELDNNNSPYELFRFVYNEGASMRGIPNKFDKLVEPLRNTIDIRFRKKAMPKMLYLPDSIVLTLFAETLLEKSSLSINDMAFSYLCLNELNDVSPLLRYLDVSADTSTYQMINMLYGKIKSIKEEKYAPKKELTKRPDKIEIR